MPGWGGYDYARIAQSLNAIEPYDIGNNIEILRSLNPRMAVLTTSFARGPWEKHRVWYELLHGNRGLIIWDDKAAFIGKDGVLGERAREVESYYREIRGGLGALLINSRRAADRIAIHYSQPSMRIEWMLKQRPKGGNWVTRNSSTEYRDSEFLRLRESFCRLIEDHGLQYNFVSYARIEQDELQRGGYKMLILPRSTALSAAEAAAIRAFAASGGTVIAEGEPGTFDERCRRLPKGQLADLFAAGSYGSGRAILIGPQILDYHQNRVVNKEGPVHREAAGWIAQAGVRPEFVVTGADGKPVTGVEVHTFHNGGARIVALHSNPELRIDELGPPEFKSNERFAKPAAVRLRLPAGSDVYDVRAGKSLGRRSEVAVTVDGHEPSIFAILPTAAPPLQLSLPATARRGDNIAASIAFAASTAAANHVFNIQVRNPAGAAVEYHSGNVLAPEGRAAHRIPLAFSEPPGRWSIEVRDVMTGLIRKAEFKVDQ